MTVTVKSTQKIFFVAENDTQPLLLQLMTEKSMTFLTTR